LQFKRQGEVKTDHFENLEKTMAAKAQWLIQKGYSHVYTLYTQETSILKKRNWYFWWLQNNGSVAEISLPLLPVLHKESHVASVSASQQVSKCIKSWYTVVVHFVI